MFLSRAREDFFYVEYREYKDIAATMMKSISGLGHEVFSLKMVCEEDGRFKWRQLIMEHCPGLDLGWAETCMEAFRKSKRARSMVFPVQTDSSVDAVLRKINEEHADSELKAQVEVMRLINRARSIAEYLWKLYSELLGRHGQEGLFRKHLKSCLPAVSYQWALWFLSFGEAQEFIKLQFPPYVDLKYTTTLTLPGVALPVRVVVFRSVFRLVRIGHGSSVLERHPPQQGNSAWDSLLGPYYELRG